ncbi:hypothetical protein COB57_00400 [Candidatus Peregrinibacteria bacterium]|nr:MAG: hypothetical protein COB57_00400 [Candidatus Peregrinibacteria bacterium]
MKKTLLFLSFALLFSACSSHDTSNNPSVQALNGKPALIVLAATFCPHCQDEADFLETEIYPLYKEDAHILINVLDNASGKQKFDVEVPQIFDRKLFYQELTGESCNLIPSWVLLKSNGDLYDYECGNTKGAEKIIKGLEKLLPRI